MLLIVIKFSCSNYESQTRVVRNQERECSEETILLVIFFPIEMIVMRNAKIYIGNVVVMVRRECGSFVAGVHVHCARTLKAHQIHGYFSQGLAVDPLTFSRPGRLIS